MASEKSDDMLESAKACYSLVIPVFNSSDNLNSIVSDFKSVLLDAGYRAELILVDDASNEETRTLSERLARENHFITAIFLKKNYGQLAATICGIHYSKGNIIITMDDDLQYPMKEILKLICRYHESRKKIVFGYPLKRMQGFRHQLLVKLGMLLFDYVLLPGYRKINFYTSFRIFDRSLFFDSRNKQMCRHLFYLWEVSVDDMDSIPVEHKPRKTGRSNYTFFKKLNTLRTVIWFALYRISWLMVFPLFIALPLSLIFLHDYPNAPALLTGLLTVFLISLALFKLLLLKERTVRYDVEKIVRLI